MQIKGGRYLAVMWLRIGLLLAVGVLAGCGGATRSAIPSGSHTALAAADPSGGPVYCAFHHRNVLDELHQTIIGVCRQVSRVVAKPPYRSACADGKHWLHISWTVYPAGRPRIEYLCTPGVAPY